MTEGKVKIRLTGRWGARLPGTVISVSKDRAVYLQNELKIGRIVGETEEFNPEPKDKPAVVKKKSK